MNHLIQFVCRGAKSLEATIHSIMILSTTISLPYKARPINLTLGSLSIIGHFLYFQYWLLGELSNIGF